MSFPDYQHPVEEKSCPYTDSSFLQKQFDHVMCFGTFDIFHPGHVFYLSEAQKFAHDMTVVIARDTRVLEKKWREPLDNEDKRLKNVQKTFPFARVILGDECDIFAPIHTLKPDLLAFGYDQRVPEDKIQELFPTIEVVRIGGFETEKWKSSLLRGAG
jgi:FAD synthetase